MEVLQIDVKGKMAHFRKYYANNTAMSFSIPPRTTIMGMLAAMLGLPKGSYHKAFASDQLRIGISLQSPVKKSFHRLNFLSIKSLGNLKTDIEKEKPFSSDFRGTGGNIQTPFEIVTGQHLQQDEICYRIFLSPHPSAITYFEQLKTCTLNRRSHFSLTLGIASFSAYISEAHLFNSEAVVTKRANAQQVVFNSAVVSDKISGLQFEKTSDSNFVEEELMPADFIDDNNRELSKMNRVLFAHNALPLQVIYTGEYYELGGHQTITFLENE
ncbi:CRISPR-associated protein Cas5 [Chitinophaga defluvii]|uniref:CRISPR-associated protein Cas5 n=1 Tax=Chitinophaga defluvii TaxID=3163343 RepID=A0ABV2T1M3_9BACT